MDVILRPLHPVIPRLLGVDYILSWVVIGGLVFVPFGAPLFNFCNKKGNYGLYYQLLKLDDITRNSKVRTPGTEWIVLVDVLAHDINVTYKNYIGFPLKEINGKEMINMKQFALEIQSIRSSTPLLSSTHSTSPTSIQAPSFVELSFSGQRYDDNTAMLSAFNGQGCEENIAVLSLTEIEGCEREIFDRHKISSWCTLSLLQEAEP